MLAEGVDPIKSKGLSYGQYTLSIGTIAITPPLFFYIHPFLYSFLFFCAKNDLRKQKQITITHYNDMYLFIYFLSKNTRRKQVRINRHKSMQ